jgi:hypothetical protein
MPRYITGVDHCDLHSLNIAKPPRMLRRFAIVLALLAPALMLVYGTLDALQQDTLARAASAHRYGQLVPPLRRWEVEQLFGATQGIRIAGAKMRQVDVEFYWEPHWLKGRIPRGWTLSWAKWRGIGDDGWVAVGFLGFGPEAKMIAKTRCKS